MEDFIKSMLNNTENKDSIDNTEDQEMSDLSVFDKEREQRKKTFNGLSAKEWTLLSRSVWSDVSSIRKEKHLSHGATYPEKLCDRTIKMYSNKGDLILDPFLGTGTTSIAAIKIGRNSVGIELTDHFFKIAKCEIDRALEESRVLLNSDIIEAKTIHGDCTTIIDELQDNSIQLTLTSPPYANLIHIVEDDRKNRHKSSAFVVENNATTKKYSDDNNDLGNMSLEQYTIAVERIMRSIFKKTKKDGYCVWVVKDYRDMKNNVPYVDLHSIIASTGVKAGFKYHDLIIWDQNEQRKLVLLGYPSRFYVNQNHSYLVVLRKW